MKICVVGAGAIGGLLAVRLAEAGEQVTVVDQGAHLQAIQRSGLKLLMSDGSEHVTRSLEAMASMRQVGPQDVVVLAVKSHILICQYPPSRALAESLMREAQAVASHLGITFRLSIEKRIAGAERVGKHKTSMLQDVEAGRGLELEAIMGAVLELARLTGIATPGIDAIYALAKLLDKTMREDHGAVQLRRIA